MGYEGVNVPFVVKACNYIQAGGSDKVLDLWARGHYKSSIITKARTIQMLLSDSEQRIAIFSHTRPAAKSFLREIKTVLQTNEMLIALFPDVLYGNAEKEAIKWSEDDGLIVKRKGTYAEASLEAWGLLEGMPTGKHFTHRIYDDIETADLVNNPETIRRLKEAFSLSQNLSSQEGTHRVIGTPYHHEGVLMHIKHLKRIDGTDMYKTQSLPATHDGTPNGRPVLLSQEKLDDLKTDERSFNCQQLLNPTPVGAATLNAEFLQTIDYKFIPQDVYKFMVVDPAGSSTTGKGDSWGIHLVGVKPVIDDIGTSNVYIMDSLISPMTDSEAIESIVRMYMNAGMVMKIGIEKVGLSSVEVHVANALRVKGRMISVDSGSLEILKPAGRNKITRIEQALAWPLNNSKLFISNKISEVYRNRIKQEMEKFPYWHDDGIDALSYVYDMIKQYRFSIERAVQKIKYPKMGVV